MAKSFIGRTDLARGIRNNNPGNMRAGDDWKGEIGVDPDGFVVFSDMSWGLRALARDLTTKYNRGLNTVREIITEYAPPSENDTAAYVSKVSDSMQVGPDWILSFPDSLSDFMRAIVNRENGDDASYVLYGDILEGINLAGSDVLSTAKEAAQNPLAIVAALLLLGVIGYSVFREK